MVRHPTETRHLLLRGVTLLMLCVISYWLITHLLARFFSVSRADDLLGAVAMSLLDRPDDIITTESDHTRSAAG